MTKVKKEALSQEEKEILYAIVQNVINSFVVTPTKDLCLQVTFKDTIKLYKSMKSLIKEFNEINS